VSLCKISDAFGLIAQAEASQVLLRAELSQYLAHSLEPYPSAMGSILGAQAHTESISQMAEVSERKTHACTPVQ